MRLTKDTVRKTVQLAGRCRVDHDSANLRAAGQALEEFLKGLSHQELIELMAVMSVGRGDPGSDDFQTLVNNIHLSAAKLVGYLINKPYLGEDLEKGMKKLGLGSA